MSEQMVEPQGSNKSLAPYSHHIPVHLMATQTSEIKSFFLQKAVSVGTESVTYLSLGQPTPFPGGATGVVILMVTPGRCQPIILRLFTPELWIAGRSVGIERTPFAITA